MLRSLLYFLLFLAGTGSYAQEKVFFPFTIHFADTTIAADLLVRARIMRDSDPDSAITLGRQALRWSEINRDVYRSGSALLLIGSCLFDKGNFKSSKAVFLQSIRYCHLAEPGYPKLLPRLYNNLANVNSKLGYNDSALFYYRRALAEIEKAVRPDSALLMQVYANLGGALANSEQSNQALFYLKKSNALAKGQKDSLSIAQNYINLGLYYETSLNQLDTALAYQQKALAIYRTKNLTANMQDQYYQMGRITGRKGLLDPCKKYLDSAVTIHPKRADRHVDLQRSLGDFSFGNRDYPKAIAYYSNALTLLKENGGIHISNIRTYGALAEAYYQMDNKDLAYQYLKIYNALRDSLLNLGKTREINKLEIQYRSAEKDKELSQQNLALTLRGNKIREKNFLLWGLTAVAVLILLFFSILFRYTRKLQREKISNMERKQEMDRLYAAMQAEEQERSRIARDLHDSVGVLLSAAVMNYTVLGKKNQIPLAETETYKEGLEILEEMKSEIRTISRNLVSEHVSDQNIAEAIQNLARKLQQDNTLRIEVYVYGEPVALLPDRSFSIYRILEELMHNTVKHAEASQMLIQLMFHEQHLNITAEDNGKGFDTSTSSSGMGMQNLRIRTERLQGSISITSHKKNGTVIELEVPYLSSTT